MSEQSFIPNSNYISSSDAALSYKCSKDYISRLCRSGKLKGQLIGRNWFIEKESFAQLLIQRDGEEEKRAQELREQRLREYSSGKIQKKESVVLQQPATSVPSFKNEATSVVLSPYAAPRSIQKGNDYTYAATTLALAFLFVFGSFSFAHSSYPQAALQAVADIRVGKLDVAEALAALSPNTELLPDAQMMAAAFESVQHVQSDFFASSPDLKSDLFERAFAKGKESFTSLFRTLTGGRVQNTFVTIPIQLPPTPVVAGNTATSTPVSSSDFVASSPAPTVISRTVVVRVPQPEDHAYTDAQIQILKNFLTAEIGKFSSLQSSSQAGISQSLFNFGISQRIDRLVGVQLTDVSVDGMSGLTDADIPDNITVSGYATLADLSALGSGFSTTTADYYVNASTTIPKTYTNNTFTGLNTFAGFISNASSTVNSNFTITGNATTSNLYLGGLVRGAGLVSCSGSGDKLIWDSTTGQFGCGTDAGGSGSGISALKAQYGTAQVGATQTLATSTSGTDFTITSAGDTHTFNLPSASAVNRGLLTPADWATFNSKQSALSFTYPFVNSAGTISLAFGTTTANTWNALQTFASGFLATASSTIGGGGQTSGLTISGGATTTGNALVQGNMRISDSGTPNTGTLYFGSNNANISHNSSDYMFTTGSIYTAAGRIVSQGNSETLGLGVRYASSLGTYFLGATNASNPDLVFTNNGISERARLTDAGFFGLGTTTPTTNLSVQGNGYISGTSFFGGAITATSTLTLSALGTPAGSFLAVDANGKIIATTTPSGGGGGSGTVTSIATNNGITGGTITGSGTIGLAAISANSILGNSTGASAVPSAIATSSLFQNASASLSGLLTSADWNTFNNKSSAGYPFALTGNATSTLTQFNSGLTAFASSTIGAGGATTGLTVLGGATTTGNAYFGSKIGIGVTTPAYPLDIYKATQPQIHIGNTSSILGGYVGSDSNDEIFLGGGVSAEVGGWTARTATPSLIDMANGVISFYTDSGKSVGSIYTASERMKITNTGLVGIGTTTPTTNLSVQGNGYISGTSFFGGAITATSTLTLSALGTPAGSFLAVDANGKIIATTTPSGGGGGSGTVTSIATNNGITGGTITGSGTIGLAAISANSILGNSTGASAVPSAIGTSTPSIGSVLTYSGTLGSFVDGSSGTFGIANTSITNAMLAGSIAYSKLSLTGAITNSDLAGSIAYSKLSLTGSILNADLAGSIAASKLVGTDIATVGTVTSGTWQGTKIGLAYGGTNADLSSTGGTSQVLRQSSSGAAITVGQLAASDLSNGTTGSGAVVLAGSPTFTGTALGSSFFFNASSTIGSGAQDAGLTIFGGATTTGNAYVAGNVGIGTTTPASSALFVDLNNINGTSRGVEIYNSKNPSTFSGTGGNLIINNTAGTTGNNAPALNIVWAGASRGYVSTLGNFAAGSGNTAIPGYYFSGDTNTGLYNPATGVLAVVSGGNEHSRFDSSGRFGIGTTTLSQTLSVQGNQYTSGSAFFGGAVTATSTLTLSALSNGGLAVNGGTVYSAATTTFSSGLTYANGNVTNTGVTALGPTGQSLTGSLVVASSTAGTDFSVTGAGSTLTFNLPTASAANRGLLSAADWTTFNNKGSGTVTSVSGTWPIISSGGNTPALSFGGLSTSTDAVIGNIPYFSGVNTFANVATSTPSIGSVVTYSGGTLGSFVGGSAGTFGIANTSITNAMLAGSIAYSKLSLTGAILNADLAGSIAYNKLSLTGAILNADLAGSIAYNKLSLTGAILNADLAGSIAYSKLSLTGAITNSDLAGSIAYSKLSLTGAILNADLAGSIAASKLVGTDIATVGTITSGTWSGSFGAVSGANLTNITAANITGSHTLPDGVLSTNVPLLNAANAFSNVGINSFAGSVLVGASSAVTVPGTATIQALGSSAGIWAVGNSGGQGAMGVYDKTSGHIGAYLFSGNGYTGIATIDNAGSYTGNPINFTTGNVLIGTTTNDVNPTSGIAPKLNVQGGAVEINMSTAAAGEVYDWPTAALSIRRIDDFTTMRMLQLGHVADAVYQTGTSVWNFSLVDNTGSKTTSDSNTALGIDGPGNLLLFAAGNGNVGVGSTSPTRKMSIQSAVSTAQMTVAYDTSRYTDFLTNSSGDLTVTPQGQDATLYDSNLWVCSGAACPSSSPTGTGNIIAETNIGIGTTTPRYRLTIESQNNSDNLFQIATSTNQKVLIVNNNGQVGIGTSTPTQQFSISDKLFVGANGASGMGTATSTFMGDIKITGKLDVSTIDPVYTIDGVKYATYGHSTIGIKEEAVTVLEVTDKNPATGKFEKKIAFKDLDKGSDLWLFYQVTDFGQDWKNLVINLTASFDGTVFYKKVPNEAAVIISASEAGEVSARFIANRFDSSKWPNIRPDQGGSYKGHELQTTNGGQGTPVGGSIEPISSLNDDQPLNTISF